MYARFVPGRAQPGKLDEFLRVMQETAPLAKRQPGNQGAGLMLDRRANKVVAYTLWDTEASMAASAQSGGSFAVNMAKIAPLYAERPTPEEYEVPILTVPGRPGLFVRITTFSIRPDKLDETVSLMREAADRAAEQPGNKGMTFLTDAQTGTAKAATLWETEAARAAGESSGFYQEQRAKLADLLAEPPGAAENFEMVIRE